MALKTKVKVGNITSLSEARFCAGMEVDFLGFPINDFEVDLKKFNEIASWVSGPQLILECSKIENIQRLLAENLENTYIQVELKNIGFVGDYVNLVVLIPEDCSTESLASLTNFKRKIKFIIVSKKYFLENSSLFSEFDVIISLPEKIDSFQLDEILHINVSGIALQGNEELKPGIQDYDFLGEILEKLAVNED